MEFESLESSPATSRQRVHTALATLEGMIAGFRSDGVIDESEKLALESYFARHREIFRRHPFIEVEDCIGKAVADGVITDDELQDIMWFVGKAMRERGGYYDYVSSSLQVLNGILKGIVADQKVSTDELISLQNWIDDHEDLRGHWPFDEIDSLISGVLDDGFIAEKEHQLLRDWFSAFAHPEEGKSIDVKSITLSGICSMNPELEFEGKSFCVTGKFRVTRKEVQTAIQRAGGEINSGLSPKVDYLIIGADGNKCWCYSCYGRKVERAQELRRQGHRIALINEIDFWDSLVE